MLNPCSRSVSTVAWTDRRGRKIWQSSRATLQSSTQCLPDLMIFCWWPQILTVEGVPIPTRENLLRNDANLILRENEERWSGWRMETIRDLNQRIYWDSAIWVICNQQHGVWIRKERSELGWACLVASTLTCLVASTDQCSFAIICRCSVLEYTAYRKRISSLWCTNNPYDTGTSCTAATGSPFTCPTASSTNIYPTITYSWHI